MPPPSLPPSISRYFRLLVLSSSGGPEDSTPLAVNRVAFEGCRPPDWSGRSDCSALPAADDASSDVEYRHFAVDDVADVVYFCDVAPTGVGGVGVRGGLRCFASDRKKPEPNFSGGGRGDHHLIVHFFRLLATLYRHARCCPIPAELPSRIVRVLGYDPASGAMLLQASDGTVYGSPDGERLTPLDPTPTPPPAGTEAARAVPGEDRVELGSVQWKAGSKYSGDWESFF